MTTDALKRYTLKDLAQMAKRSGVHGWQSMRKDQLVKALAKSRAPSSRAAAPATRARTATATRTGAATRAAAATRATAATPARKAAAKPVRKPARATHVNGTAARTPAVARVTTHRKNGSAKPAANGQAIRSKETRPKVLARLEQARARYERQKNLALNTPGDAAGSFRRDRLVALVRDPYWLHAYWELTRQSVQRAEAAMGQDWHTARPVLRLLEVSDSGATSTAEAVLRDIEIHGGVNNWYVDVQDPPKSYRLDIGYLASSGRFYVLARSNTVTTPRAGTADAIDENWTDVAENFDKIYAMSCGSSPTGPSQELQDIFEERLRRPMSSNVIASGGESLINHHRNGFDFELDAELIVFGTTEPGARVTLQGDPVRLRPDGTFTVRFSMPNCRQVIPAVAVSADGIEQRTVVLAVERNTKTMEPLVRDGNE